MAMSLEYFQPDSPMTHENSSPSMASLVSRAMRDPASLSLNEIRSLAACVLTQARNKEPEAPVPEPIVEDALAAPLAPPAPVDAPKSVLEDLMRRHFAWWWGF